MRCVMTKLGNVVSTSRKPSETHSPPRCLQSRRTGAYWKLRYSPSLRTGASSMTRCVAVPSESSVLDHFYENRDLSLDSVFKVKMSRCMDLQTLDDLMT